MLLVPTHLGSPGQRVVKWLCYYYLATAVGIHEHVFKQQEFAICQNGRRELLEMIVVL